MKKLFIVCVATLAFLVACSNGLPDTQREDASDAVTPSITSTAVLASNTVTPINVEGLVLTPSPLPSATNIPASPTATLVPSTPSPTATLATTSTHTAIPEPPTATRTPLPPTATPTHAPTATPTPLPPTATPVTITTATAIPANPTIIVFEGTGRQATDIFGLEAGIAIFAFEHDGSSNFVVRILDDFGIEIEVLADEIGEFSRSRVFSVEESGTFILDVLGDGDWKISITPRPVEPTPTPTFTASPTATITPSPTPIPPTPSEIVNAIIGELNAGNISAANNQALTFFDILDPDNSGQDQETIAIHMAMVFASTDQEQLEGFAAPYGAIWPFINIGINFDSVAKWIEVNPVLAADYLAEFAQFRNTTRARTRVAFESGAFRGVLEVFCDIHDENASANWLVETYSDLFACPIKPPSGLVHWWPGDGNSDDIIGSKHGVLTNSVATFTDGLVGQAFSFDGNNSFALAAPQSVSNTGSWTYVLWINVDSYTNGSISGGSGSYFIDRVGSSVGLASLKAVDSRFAFQIRYDDGSVIGGPVGGVIPLGKWTHIAMVRESGDWFHLYVNGELVSSFPDSGLPLTLPVPEIGRHERSGGGFVGAIDEFSIFNRALRNSEITNIYEAGSLGMVKR